MFVMYQGGKSNDDTCMIIIYNVLILNSTLKQNTIVALVKQERSAGVTVLPLCTIAKTIMNYIIMTSSLKRTFMTF